MAQTIGEQKVCPESESLTFSAIPTPQVENPSDSDSTALVLRLVYTKRDAPNCRARVGLFCDHGRSPKSRRVRFASAAPLLLEERRVRTSRVFRVDCLSFCGGVSTEVTIQVKL